MKRLALSLAVLLSAASVGAAITIDLGNPKLLPNTANQKIPITVTGGPDEVVSGADLFFQLGDGGALVEGTDTSPPYIKFAPFVDDPNPANDGVDPITGTIFATNHSEPWTVGGTDLFYSASVTTSTGTIPANGLLTTVTLDTTGVTNGTFQLRMDNIAPFVGATSQFLTDINHGDPVNHTFTPVVVGGTITVGDLPPTTEGIAATVDPNTGLRTTGQTIKISNAASSAGKTRDAATINGIAITQGPVGTFTLGGVANNDTVAPGADKTGTVGFNAPGILNGVVSNGTLTLNVAPGSTPGGTGGGARNYNLQGVVTGNVGNGTAPVAAGGSFAGLSSTSDKELGTVATMLAGTNAGGDTNLGMSWQARGANEKPPGGTHPPLPDFSNGLISDKLTISGIDTGDSYVLQLTYDPSLIKSSEDQAGALGQLFLAELINGNWVHAGTPGVGANILGSWASAGSPTTVGASGFDPTANTVWAVLNHGGQFAAVPEPSSLIILGLGAILLVPAARRFRVVK